jgi:hypothetical protein
VTVSDFVVSVLALIWRRLADVALRPDPNGLRRERSSQGEETHIDIGVPSPSVSAAERGS